MSIQRGRVWQIILGVYLLLVTVALLFSVAVPALLLGIVAGAAAICLLFGL